MATTKPKSTAAAQAPTASPEVLPPLPQPTAGGCYVRQPDGSLTRETTSEEPAGAAPAQED